MKRWHQDLTITLREWKKHRRSHVESNKNSGWRYDRRLKQSVFAVGADPYEVDCDYDEQIGRFRKKDAWDCGNTRCYICHSDKFPKREPHEQELQAALSFKEQVKEFYEDRYGVDLPAARRSSPAISLVEYETQDRHGDHLPQVWPGRTG